MFLREKDEIKIKQPICRGYVQQNTITFGILTDVSKKTQKIMTMVEQKQLKKI